MTGVTCVAVYAILNIDFVLVQINAKISAPNFQKNALTLQ